MTRRIEHYMSFKILSQACQSLGWRLNVVDGSSTKKGLHPMIKNGLSPHLVIEDRTVKEHCFRDGCMNGRVVSIAKTRVDELHSKHFGRSIDIDPTEHSGLALEKGDANCSHHYNVVTCPTERRSGFVYQKILGGIVEEKTEYKLYILFDHMILQAVRFTFPPGGVNCHKAQVKGFEIVPLESIYRTDEERENLKAFISDFKIDFARFDILLDDDGLPYVLDVNDTAVQNRDFHRQIPELFIPTMCERLKEMVVERQRWRESRAIILPQVPHSQQKIIAYVQWYVSPNEERMQEINFCVRRLLANSEIAEVVLCIPSEHVDALPQDLLDIRSSWTGKEVRIHALPEGDRLRYQTVTEAAVCKDTVYMVLNSDIVVPETAARQIRELLYRPGPTKSICLTRYESSIKALGRKSEDAGASFTSTGQDLWAFRGGEHIRSLPIGDIPLGIPGCERSFAWALSLTTQTLNPSRRIRTYHIHSSNFRTYTARFHSGKTPKPYLFVNPTH